MTKGFDYFMVHVKLGTNRKYRRLSVAERWCTVSGVWALAAQSPIRGALLIADDEPATVEDIAEEAGVPKSVAESTLEKLTRLGELLHDDDLGCLVVEDWDKHQPSPRPSDSADARRERKRRERDRKRDVTSDSHADVTRDTPRDVTTPGHAMSRGEEKRREENNDETALSGKPDVAQIESARNRIRREQEQQVFDAWVDSTGKTGRTVFDDKRRKIVRKALEHFPVDEVVDAVKGWRHSPHHRGENDQRTVYNDIELLLRDSKQIEKFRDLERGQAGRSARSQASLDRLGGTA